MNIEFLKDGQTLTACPLGRLDSNSSPKLEAELKARLDGITSLILDFAGVDYISSAGLRVILTMDQQILACGGSLKIIHVNENILNIFDMTGFLDIISIEP